jgi:hypothetical protein
MTALFVAVSTAEEISDADLTVAELIFGKYGMA